MQQQQNLTACYKRYQSKIKHKIKNTENYY